MSLPPFSTSPSPRGRRPRTLTLLTALALTLGLCACGGGGGGGAEPSPAPAPNGQQEGALVFLEPRALAHFALSDGQTTRQSLSDFDVDKDRLGHGGHAFVASSALPAYEGLSRWTRWAGAGGFASLPGLGERRVGLRTGRSGYVASRLQASPDGSAVAYTTREHAEGELGAAFDPWLYVLRSTDLTGAMLPGYTDVEWIDAQRLVGSQPDGLFLLQWDGDGTLVETRIGPVGLGRPGGSAEVKQPSVSAQGDSIAFVQDGAIWRIGLDGQGLTQLTTGAEAAWPSWSPDGRRIVALDAPCTGALFHTSKLRLIDATRPLQVLADAALPAGQAIIQCGPVYWIP